jgi:hypothetical protein
LWDGIHVILQISPTDFHRFIYKSHTYLLGFKRRGMLVNHLAKCHPDISSDSVPELNLPILKTTWDYYCQYCEKVNVVTVNHQSDGICNMQIDIFCSAINCSSYISISLYFCFTFCSTKELYIKYSHIK